MKGEFGERNRKRTFEQIWTELNRKKVEWMCHAKRINERVDGELKVGEN